MLDSVWSSAKEHTVSSDDLSHKWELWDVFLIKMDFLYLMLSCIHATQIVIGWVLAVYNKLFKR